MTDGSLPVVLVHGWKSHPGVWDPLADALEEQSIETWTFDHSRIRGAGVDTLASFLQEFINRQKAETGYRGGIDIVCHSMGTGIARYLIEVIKREAGALNVRQLIGLGPPNNGSSLAELFFDPMHATSIIRSLGGVFVPRRFNPDEDIIVRQFRPGSVMMKRLRSAGLRDDCRYRLILTENPCADPEFFPPFRGKTWVMTPAGWETTYFGDGVVPHHDSWLFGACYDIFPKDPALFHDSPDLYCHLHLPQNPEVIDRVMSLLTDHCPVPGESCPGN